MQRSTLPHHGDHYGADPDTHHAREAAVFLVIIAVLAGQTHRGSAL
jgi:hypothetical protein